MTHSSMDGGGAGASIADQKAGPSATGAKAGSEVRVNMPQDRFVPPRPTPVWTCTVKLNTDFAQRVYKRTWDRLKADLYVLTVRTRSSGMDEAAKAIEGVISEAFEHARRDLEGDLARSEAIMDDVKLTDLPTYKGAQTVEAEYSTPRAKEFLNLLLQMDQLLTRYDALWLTGQIETQQRIQRSQNWQRRLIKIANRLRELGNRTRTGLAREMDKRTEKTEQANAANGVAANADEGGTETLEEPESSTDAAQDMQAATEKTRQNGTIDPVTDSFAAESIVVALKDVLPVEQDSSAAEHKSRRRATPAATTA